MNIRYYSIHLSLSKKMAKKSLAASKWQIRMHNLSFFQTLG